MSENIINIDGSEYQFESLKDEAKICIAHVTQLQNEIDMLQMKLVQLNVAKDSFMKTLKSSLPEEESDDKSEEEVLEAVG
jgi:predicted transcriptional regulator